MTKRHAQKGFTLVELAISLTIIGLLIGGVLKGKQLMENARVASAVAQVASVKAATATFLRTYNGLPGDLKNAQARIPKCSNCQLSTSASWAGDGAVGLVNWDLQTAQANTSLGGSPHTAAQNETLLFWAELGQAGLLAGVSYDGSSLSGITPEFGVHAPAARIGGGWIVGQADGVPAHYPPLSTPPSGSVERPNGLFLVLTSSLTDDLTTTGGMQVLTPLSAAGIDDKIDDGLPFAGTVRAYGATSGGTNAGCMAMLRPENTQPYNESVQSKDCGVFVQINN